MPSDEPSSNGRCATHPRQQAVASCAGCGRATCIRCSIPVRGEVYGSECLEALLGPGAATDPGPIQRRGIRLPLVAAGFLVGVVATALPWKRFGLGSGPFGAYGLVPRWSWVAAAAAIIGLAIWALWTRRKRPPGNTWRPALLTSAVVLVLASLLSILDPPGFGPITVGPFAALLGGIVALAAVVKARPSATRPSEEARSVARTGAAP